MKLKLISKTGHREDTKVVNAETGEMIEGIQSLKFTADVLSLARLELVVICPEVEVEVTPDQVSTAVIGNLPKSLKKCSCQKEQILNHGCICGGR